MAGSSYTALETQYGELSGVVASQWGEDAMATIDDKLHMTDNTNIQTIQGPLNFSTTNVITFAGPMNFSTTGVSTWAGALNFSTSATHTWAGPVDFNSTGNMQGAMSFQTHVYLGNGTTYYINQVGSPNFNQMTVANAATFNGAIDANSTMNVQSIATFQTGINVGGTGTFAGVDMVNTVSEFSTDTTMVGNSDTAVPTEKALKTYIDERTFYGSSNGGWIGVAMIVFAANTESWAAGYAEWDMVNTHQYRNIASDNSRIRWLVPLPSKLDSGKSLYIDKVKCKVLVADSNNYIGNCRLIGLPNYVGTFYDDLWVDTTDVNSATTKEWSFTAVDCGDNETIILYMDFTFNGAGAFRFLEPAVHFYYDS